MRNDTTRMSAMSHQLMGGRSRKAVSQVISRQSSVGSRQSGSSNLFRGSHNLNHFADGVNPYHMRSGEHGGGDGGRRAPITFDRRAPAHLVVQERLAGRTD